MPQENPKNIYQEFAEMITEVDSLLQENPANYAEIYTLLEKGGFTGKILSLVAAHFAGDDAKVSAAKHDIQGPLATVFSQIELLTDDEIALSAEDRNFITSTISTKWELFKSAFEALSSYDANEKHTQLAAFLIKLTSLFPRINISADYGDLQPGQINELETMIPTADLKISILELFNNSLKHGATGVNFRVTLTAESLIVEVEDDGTGIGEERLAEVQAALEAHSTTTAEPGVRGSSGSGLALIQNRGAIVKIEALQPTGVRQTLIAPLPR